LFSELDAAAGEDGADAGYAAGLASGQSLELDFETAGRRERLEQALRELPDHQRVPLVLFHFENASYHEIAATLGISLGKVKTDIHRARETLRKRLIDDHAPR
jgi:RNA polymerase sigma-70 factor (ECF subfamily)